MFSYLVTVCFDNHTLMELGAWGWPRLLTNTITLALAANTANATPFVEHSEGVCAFI